jgi:hypothetical protein
MPNTETQPPWVTKGLKDLGFHEHPVGSVQ